MPEAGHFLVSGLNPSFLPMLEPQAVGFAMPDGSSGLNSGSMHVFAEMVASACSVACARWFLSMRGCIQRERVRQQLFREENGLPKDTKLPYERQPLTEAELVQADMSESIMRSMFGDGVADYAREKFLHAMASGDMRSFKIRLLMIKARDSLKNTHMYLYFSTYVDRYIAEAERMAGCIPDPTPRRMSKAEKEHKRLSDEKKARRYKNQLELPLEWPDGDADQDIEPKASPQDSATGNGGLASLGSPQEEGVHQDIEKGVFAVSPKPKKGGERGKRTKDSPKKDSVTVTGGVTVTHHPRQGGKGGKIIRKARNYDSVEQILDDIEEGKIVPYENAEEICADLKAGLIDPVEAMMFTAAMDRYITSLDSYSPQLEMEGECDEDDEDFEDEDDEYREIEDRRGGGPAFSYNPKGFAGCCSGHYSGAGMDWNTDDEC